MAIREEKEAKPAVKTEKPVEATDEDAIKQMTNREFLDYIKPSTYKRFAPRRRRVFRLRLPFTYDYE